MKRRDLLKLGVAGGVASVAKLGSGASPGISQTFELSEVSIDSLKGMISRGAATSLSITRAYLRRIGEIDQAGPQLRSVIEVSPRAEEDASKADEARKDGRSLPLLGIPILLKDNIETADGMLNTAGSLLLLDNRPTADAFLVQRLRQAGAIILGKTNLSEWANFRSTKSTSGWSGRGGQTKNPYALDRNPCGSSSGSGVAVAASLCAAAVGTETDGSIVCPSTNNGLVGIKPTLGLISRSGILPLAHSQDTAGPMARTVRDAAILLQVLAGADPKDAASRGYKGQINYTQFLRDGDLKGVKIGIARQFFGFNPKVDKVMEEAIAALKSLRAEIVDPANLPSHGKYDASEFEVLLYEFKADLNAYLASRNLRAKSLRDLIRMNEEMKDREMPYFGQEIFLMAQEKGPLSEKKYRDALAANHRLSRDEGIDAVVRKHGVHAILGPTGGPAWMTDLLNGDHYTGGCSTPAAVSGYPAITVPAGMIRGLPVGVSFFGPKWSEPILLRIAYAFEKATTVRQAPKFLPTALPL